MTTDSKTLIHQLARVTMIRRVDDDQLIHLIK